jgi:hypothetical protein
MVDNRNMYVYVYEYEDLMTEREALRLGISSLG